tara:strand:+ start:520 stop:1038 length:519 start_codon:yes stop_codon:yes gene_type:complete
MACGDITVGRARKCKGQGGNEVLYIYNYLVSPFTYADGIVTALDGLTGGTVFKFDLQGDGDTLEENNVSDESAGTSVNTQTLTARARTITAVDSANFNLLVTGNSQAVLKDNNGVYHALGLNGKDGMTWSNVASTGGARTDFNGYTITATSQTNGESPKLDAAMITAFEALV